MNVGDVVIPRAGKIMLDNDTYPTSLMSCKWHDGIGVVLNLREANSGSNRCWVQVLSPYGIGWCYDRELIIVMKGDEDARRAGTSNEQR